MIGMIFYQNLPVIDLYIIFPKLINEAALINAFNYVSDIGLTNIVAGHHSAEALDVENFERINGAACWVLVPP